MTKKTIISFIGALIVASAAVGLGLTSQQVNAQTIDDTPDYDNVAIIRGGVSSTSDAREKCKDNKTGDLDNVFKAFGFDCDDISGMVSGIVWKNGNVTVDGKVVATDAMTAGRNYGGTHIAGSDNAGKYSTSKFVDDGQTALIKMVNGKFEFAIVKPCGNPVSAKPKETPKPAYTCDSLKVSEKISRTKFEFVATGDADNGAKITGYRFDFGDGTSSTSDSRTITHTYSSEGSYTVSVEIRVTVDGDTKYVDGSNCDVKVIVAPPPTPVQVEVCNPTTGETITVDKTDQDKYKPVGDEACSDVKVCNPADKTTITVKKSKASKYKPVGDAACEEKKGEETPVALPSTGPTDYIVGGLGVSSVTAAGYYLRASRRNLINKFMNR